MSLLLLAHQQQIEFRVQTNESVPAELALATMAHFIEIARSPDFFGPETQIEITALGPGSFFGRVIVPLSVYAGIGSFVFAAADFLRSGEHDFAVDIARICIEHGGADCTITGGGVEVRIGRDEMAAVNESHTLLPPEADFIKIPRSFVRPPNVQRTVHFVGRFETADDGTTVFITEGGVIYPVFGTDWEIDFPTGVRVFVTGFVPEASFLEGPFYPNKIARIDDVTKH